MDREEADDDDYEDKYVTKLIFRPLASSAGKPKRRQNDMGDFIGRTAVLQKQPSFSNSRKAIVRSPARIVGKQKPVVQQQSRASCATIATQTSATSSAVGTPRSGSGRRKSSKPSPIRDMPTVPDATAMHTGNLSTNVWNDADRRIVSDVLSLDHNAIVSRPSKSSDRRATAREPPDSEDYSRSKSPVGGRRMRPSRKAAPKSFAHWTKYFSSNRDIDDDGGADRDGDRHGLQQCGGYYADDEERAVEITTDMLRDLQADDEEEEYQQPEKGYDEDDSAEDDDDTNTPRDEESDDNFDFNVSAARRRGPTMNAAQTKAGASSSARRGIKRKRARPTMKAGMSNFADSLMLGTDAEDVVGEKYRDNKKKLEAYEVDQLLYHQKESDLKRNFACPDCGKSYTTPSNLTRHR